MITLEQAIEKLRRLPKLDQDRFASMVLDEEVWNEAFGKSTQSIDRLGESVLADIMAGKFKRMKD
jgi:hypothetical protein